MPCKDCNHLAEVITRQRTYPDPELTQDVAFVAFLMKKMDSRRDWFADVLAFHNKFGSHIEGKPKFPAPEVIELRNDLITEEFNELMTATAAKDMPDVADAMADLMYVVIGTAISYGIDLRLVWEAVQTANMAKVGGGKRKDGKILKPPGWTAPDIAAVLKNQSLIVDSRETVRREAVPPPHVAGSTIAEEKREGEDRRGEDESEIEGKDQA